MRTLLLAAGGSDAFADAGYFFPKNLIEIAGSPLLEHVIHGLGPLATTHRLVVAVRREENVRFHTSRVVRLIEPTAAVVEVGETSGAACTALTAVDHLLDDEPLLVCNGDQVIDVDLAAVVDGFATAGLDGGVVVFEGVHPRWSYVRTDDAGIVIEASEKRPISRLATAGCYWFARGRDFVESAKQMILKDAQVNGQFFVCPALNEMVLAGRRVGIHRIERAQYFSFHDPQAVGAFEARLALDQEAA